MTRPRVIISTDIGGNDKDDAQSLIHALLYADKIDYRGFISTLTDAPKADGLSVMNKVFDAYAKDLPNLRKAGGQWADAEKLRSMMATGGRDPDWPGVKSEGVQLIIDEARAASPADPLYVLTWGPIHDVALALKSDPSIVPNIRVISISGLGQDPKHPQAYDWMRSAVATDPKYKDLWWINSTETHRGMYASSEGENDPSQNMNWVKKFIDGHGALGDLFHDTYAFDLYGPGSTDGLKMGDTPSLLYLIDAVNNNDPSASSWGGSYAKNGLGPNTWGDKIGSATQLGSYDGARTVYQHREAAWGDFAKRMDWADGIYDDLDPPIDPTAIDGTEKDDALSGTSGKEVIRGYGGADLLRGNGGEDVLIGGAGADTLVGANSADYLKGGSGRDVLTGNGGADRFVLDLNSTKGGVDDITDFRLGDGDRIVIGNVLPKTIDAIESFVRLEKSGTSAVLSIDPEGDGTFVQVAILRNAGELTLDAMIKAKAIVLVGTVVSGPDLPGVKPVGAVITGTSGYDEIKDGNNSSTIYGLAGDDDLLGNGGNDLIFGGTGNDLLRGDAGNDTLNGGAGSDSLKGGSGVDTFAFGKDALDGSKDRIDGFSRSEGDRIDLSGIAEAFGWSDAEAAGYFSVETTSKGVDLVVTSPEYTGTIAEIMDATAGTFGVGDMLF